MKINYDVLALLWKKRTNTATPEELTRIEALIHSSTDVWEEWNTIANEPLSDSVLRMAHNGETEKMVRAFKRKTTSKKLGKKAAITVCLAAVVAVAVYGYRFFTNHADPLMKSQFVMLERPDGTRLVLDSTWKEHMDTTEWTYKNTGLSFNKGKGAHGEWYKVVVPEKQEFYVTLPDKSYVKLNSTTVLKLPADFNDDRLVYLEGEARFEINASSQHPFTVRTNTCDVLVLGTIFNVNTFEPGIVKAALYQGIIKMKAGAAEKVIRPYTEGIFEDNTLRLQPADVVAVMSWTNGLYHFNNKPLYLITDIVERWYGVKMIISDEQLRTRTMSGMVDRDEPIEEFIDNLEGSLKLKCVKTDGRDEWKIFQP